MIHFVVPLEPRAKGRPRFSRGGGVYTDPKTRLFERQLKFMARKFAPAIPLEGPLEIVLLFCLRKPRGVKRRHPWVRPDLDNFQKAVLDSFNGLFWKDDGQLISIQAKKAYDVTPSIHIAINQVPDA